MTAEIAKRAQVFINVLEAENEALAAGQYDALSKFLPEKRAASEGLQVAIQMLSRPEGLAKDRLEAIALRLDSVMARNDQLLSQALTAQRKLVELLLHSTRERVSLGLYGQAGRYHTPSPVETKTISRWTLATA